MKTSRIVHTPTRSRILNLLLGAVLLSAAVLLLVALAGYHAADASLDTATDSIKIANWTGKFGAYVSDVLLQVLGVTAFCLPLWLGGVGVDWMRSQKAGSVILRGLGILLTLAFVPTVLAMLPWHWQWLHALPIEGVVGAVIAPALLSLHLPAATHLAPYHREIAYALAGLLAVAGMWLGSALNIRNTREWLSDSMIRWQATRDRYDNWRADRADLAAQKAEQAELDFEQEPSLSPLNFGDEQVVEAPKRSVLAGLFKRRRQMQDPDEIPAYKRAAFTELGMEYPTVPNAEQVAEPEPEPYVPAAQERTSIWERRSRFVAEEPAAPVAMPEQEHVAEYAAESTTEPMRRPIAEPMAEIPVAEPVRAPRWQNDEPASTPIAAPIIPTEPITASVHEPEPIAADPVISHRAEPIPFPVRAIAPEPMPEPVAPVAEDDFFDDELIAEEESSETENIEVHERADIAERSVTVAPRRVSNFKLPPSTLLTKGEEPLAVREELLREEARTLVEKCAEFDVHGQVVQINPGPMVTTYEFKPEAGVKYSRVTGLSDDLCLAMAAESILIERMAGKSTVGIQVPNHERETIHLRDVIESETFATAKSRLTMAMGKDINGRIVTADLATMPHVLIAGSTGSGKSVAINAMIMSLLYRTTPDQVRLILVDPKRVELGMYEGVPHLFTPIITEPKLAANALRNAVREMERRLKLLASRSVRNIDQYNKLFEGSGTLFHDNQEGGVEETPLPYIVIVIDELADLMMLDRANVEESITRLAQMARAVGIHLVLATQRPSVDVITGLIKANVPTRMSFRLATKVDSRTIIDINGAESLLGRGDMLFLPPGTSRLLRLHAPFVSEKETAALVSFWKAQGEAEYAEGFLDSPKDERGSGEGANSNEEDHDELFDDAVRLVFEFGKASTSLLQRRLRIGYGRAAHLIDMMERDGLVGPADGSRPRELLKSPGWLHEVSSGVEE